jgi:hypothetical protein
LGKKINGRRKYFQKRKGGLFPLLVMFLAEFHGALRDAVLEKS